MSTPEEQAALDAAKAEAAEALAAEQAAREAEEAAEAARAQAAKDAETPEALKEALRKERKDGSKANREAQAAKKEAEALKAKLQAIEDKDKTALELATSKLKEAEQEKNDLLAKVAKQERKSAARDAGVDPQYADYAAAEFAKADPETKAVDFFKEFKESHPAMFGGNGEAAGSGAGGPPIKRPGEKAARLKAIEERVKVLSAYRGSDQVEKELWDLSSEASKIQKELKPN